MRLLDMPQKEPTVPPVLLSIKSLHDFHSLAVLYADEYTVLRVLYAYALQAEVNGLAVLSLDACDTGGSISYDGLGNRLHAILHGIYAIVVTLCGQSQGVAFQNSIAVFAPSAAA